MGAERLDLGPWLGKDIPQAVLSLSADLGAELENLSQLRLAAVDLRIQEGSRWNKQPLAGAPRPALPAATTPAAVAGGARRRPRPPGRPRPPARPMIRWPACASRAWTWT